nr:MAG TPA: hypothetical protein [Caudoviricetes sp.]
MLLLLSLLFDQKYYLKLILIHYLNGLTVDL